MSRPTTRWFVGLAALAVVPLAVPDPVAGWWLLALAAALWTAVLLLDGRRAPGADAIDVMRDAPRTGSAGRPLVAAYRWRLRAGRTRGITVLERLPAPIDDGRDATRLLQPTTGRWLEETHAHVPPHRGRGDGGTLHLLVQGPWGLAERRVVLERPWSLVVLPALDEEARPLPTARRRREAGQRPDRVPGEGRELDSLRDWVPGDDTRTLDWKATARRGKPIVRRFRDERRQPVLLAIDAGRLMAARHAGRTRLDAAVDAAAALGWAVHAHDDDIGLLVFDAEPRVRLAPRRGRAGLRQVLEGLAGAEARAMEPDWGRAIGELARAQRRRALVVLFTDVVDADVSAALVQQARALRPRHLPVVVALRDPALEALETAPADSVADAYARAAAEALRQARQAALDRMRADGVVVVDAPTHHAAAAVVRTYESLKRRGAL